MPFFCPALRSLRFTGLLAIALSPASLLRGQSLTYTGSSPALDFGNVNLCPAGASTPSPCSETLTLTYSVTGSGTLGTPKVLTVGSPNLDFTLASGSTCIGAVTKGHSCTVNVTFNPLYAGARNGAVQIVKASGTVTETTLIYGLGIGPQIAFGPGVPEVPGGDLFYLPTSIAIDGVGDLFVPASYLNDSVACECIAEFPVGGGPQTLASDFATVDTSLALDGAGDLFMGGLGSNIFEQLPGGGPQVAVTYGANPFAGDSIAVDGKGDLFATQTSGVDELAVGGSAPIALPFTGSTEYFAGLAIDNSGDVFAADYNNALVLELAAGSDTPVTLPFKGLVSPYGVAVDAAGDVFVTEYGAESPSQVLELPADGGAQIVVPFNSVNFPQLYVEPRAVALSADGNIFISANSSYNLLELQRAQPPSFSFAATAIGQTNDSGPYSVQFQNIGNRTMTGAVTLSDTADFEQALGKTSYPDCSPTLSLAPGATCNFSVSFIPQSTGPITGSLILSGNGKLTAQSIPLSGTGVDATLELSTNVLSFGTVVYPGTETLPLTLTNVGDSAQTITPSIDGSGFVVSGNTCGAFLAAGHSCVIQVEFLPKKVGTFAYHLTLTTNGPLNPVVSLTGTSSGIEVVPSTTSLTFGSVPFGTEATQTLTLKNLGLPGIVTIGGTVDGPSYIIPTTSENTCQAGITSGHSCVLPVEFKPAKLGNHIDTLILTPSFGAVLDGIKLYGEGQGIMISATSLHFGTIALGTTSTMSLTLTTVDEGGTQHPGISINGPSYKVASSSSCLYGVPPNGESCTLTIEFNPVSVGEHRDELKITPAHAPARIIPLDGTAD